MGELLQNFMTTLTASVESLYNLAWALSLVLLLTKFHGAGGRLLWLLPLRLAIALPVVWLLGTVSDLIFPNSITWTVAPAAVCGAIFWDRKTPAQLVRIGLVICAWLYSLSVADMLNAELQGGIELASVTSLAYMLLLRTILVVLERHNSLDEDNVSLSFVIPVLIVCASGLAERAILYLRSDFGLVYYSASTLESFLTCLNGQLAELVVYWAVLRLARELREKERIQAERHLMEGRYQALVAYRESGESLRRLRHEVKNQYAYIRMLLEQKDYARAEEFFGEMSLRANPTFSMVASGNDLVDDIVNIEVAKARAAGVEISARIAVPPELPYEEIDLCSLLMNLLDNAIEACAEGDEKNVRLGIVVDQGALAVTVVNPSPHEPRRSEAGALVTTKKDPEGHGYGTSIVRAVAEKYDGAADFTYYDGEFVARVMLALPA